ncbi:MAG: hypothetical protein R3A80_13550 [Bdellovibrionota bacterium]
MPFKRSMRSLPIPALDLNASVSQIVENEKNYVSNEKRYQAETPINAAPHVLNHLEYPVRAGGF